MHYLIITSEFPPGPGGIGKHAYCLSKSLLNNSVKVSVVCNMDNTTESEIKSFIDSVPEGLEVHRIKRKGLSTYVDRVKEILSLYKNVVFDKVIVSGQFSLWMGWLLKIRFRNKVVVDAFIHGSELFYGNSIRRQLTKISLKSTNNIYAVSNYTAKLLQKLHNYQNISVIPNGLDVNEWSDVEQITPFMWDGYPNLLTVGSISTRKGQHNVINALPELLKHYPQIHYHIVGIDTAKNELITLIKKLSLESHVTIHGKLNQHDIKRAYKTANIFCMLSEAAEEGDIEGFGIAILEANIMGLPAIGSLGTGIEDAICNDYNGYLVDCKNIDSIRNAVNMVLTIDKIEMSRNCVTWAYRHNWDNLVKALL